MDSRTPQLSDPEADLDLLRAAVRGLPEARRRLSLRLACVPAMVRAKHRRMGKPLTADELFDVEQEIFAAIWDKLTHYEGRSRLETWVWSFCELEILKGVDRKRRRHEPVAEVERLLPSREIARPADLPPSLEYEHVHRSLDNLQSPGGDVIRLKHFEGLTFNEIAERLEVSHWSP